MLQKFYLGTRKAKNYYFPVRKRYCRRWTDINKFECVKQGLKITWIPKFVKEEDLWQDLFESSIMINRKYIWMQDLLSLYNMKSQVKNLFWNEVFWAWIKYKEISIDEIDVRTFLIWKLYFLQNNNIIMKKTEFERNSLVYINNLGELMGYDNFQEIYNLKINFVDCYSLMHSIPRPWKKEILQQKNKIIGQVTQTCLKEILNMKKCVKRHIGTLWTQ